MARSSATRTYSAREVFTSAVQFNATCNFIHRVDLTTEGDIAAAISHPIVALSALTIELLLKTLHALHSENPVPQFHNLSVLYRGLDKRTQVEIQNGWKNIFVQRSPQWEQIRRSIDRNSPPMSDSVGAALEEGALAFERFRYAFDKSRPPPNYFIDDLRRVLILIVLKRRPEWASIGFHLERAQQWDRAPAAPSPPESRKA